MFSKPRQGRCTIGDYSGLRKRMRAMRRGIIPVPVITEKMLMRHAWYRRKKMWDAIRAKQSA